MEIMTAKIRDIDRIKELFKQVDNKTKFMEKTALMLDKSPRTLRTHWFADSGFWSVPKEYQKQVIKLLNQTIKNQ